MGSNVRILEAQVIETYRADDSSKSVEDLLGCELAKFATNQDSTHSRLGRGAGVAKDSLDDVGPDQARTKDGITGTMHRHRNIAFIILLKFKCDGTCIGVSQLWVVVRQLASVLVEPNVLKAKQFCSSDVARYFEVFTRAHAIEECAPGELSGGHVALRQVILGHLSKDLGW